MNSDNSSEKPQKFTVLKLLLSFGAFFIPLILIIHFTYYHQGAKPLKIGVLLPLTGNEAMGFNYILDQACAQVNNAGGIGGRKLELVYCDTNGKDIEKAAESLVNQEDINIVIGPNSSDDAFKVTPMFIARNKLLLSPTATSVDLYRAFGGKGIFWRTCRGDISQIRTILHILEEKGVKKIAVLGENTAYGKSFTDWIPFFAKEMGITLCSNISFPANPNDNSISYFVAETLKTKPEYLIVATISDNAVKIIKELRKQNSSVKVMLTDAAKTPYFIKALKEHAEGLEGTAPGYVPDSEFNKFLEKYHNLSPAYAATVYDTFLLAVCALARNQQQQNLEWVDDSFKEILSWRGEQIDWRHLDLAVKAILSGEKPELNGASGPLKFDRVKGVDPIEGYYSYWVVKDGKFQIKQMLSSAGTKSYGQLSLETADSGVTASKRLAKLNLKNSESSGNIKDRNELWAVIISTSESWENYRHQADALSFYHSLKRNGVKDDRIILILADDIAFNKKNIPPGSIKHYASGQNLYENTEIDYRGQKVNLNTLEKIMLGDKVLPNCPKLESGPNSNIVLFVIGHGEPGKILFGNGDDFSAFKFKKILENMSKQKRFRQMLVILEACFGESMAQGLDTPNVLLLTGSADNEQSFGANYDSKLNVWLSNEFTKHLIDGINHKPHAFISEFYSEVYSKVSGSHVRLKNYENFDDIKNTRISDFTNP
jgi:ABC-type branched-subunit amino acid transport system substrate-binding protein/glycosylphosphatidylinositol transamidase (GPIT) subunit GPI8